MTKLQGIVAGCIAVLGLLAVFTVAIYLSNHVQITDNEQTKIHNANSKKMYKSIRRISHQFQMWIRSVGDTH